MLDLLDALASEPGSPPVPQLIIVDGNGLLHGMGAGVACHIGVRSGVAAIGAAKTFFDVSGLRSDAVKITCRELLRERGDHVLILNDVGEYLGAAVRTTSDATAIGAPSVADRRGNSRCCGKLDKHGAVSSAVVESAACGSRSDACKPLFVSVGHGVTLPTALQLVLLCCLHRVPEPVRLADKRSRQVMAELDAACTRGDASTSVRDSPNSASCTAKVKTTDPPDSII